MDQQIRLAKNGLDLTKIKAISLLLVYAPWIKYFHLIRNQDTGTLIYDSGDKVPDSKSPGFNKRR